MDYNEFLLKKRFILESSGFNIDKYDLNLMLYDFQLDIVRWALAKGRAAIFADCGLGKTPMQLEWEYQVHQYTGGNVLLLAPRTNPNDIVLSPLAGIGSEVYSAIKMGRRGIGIELKDSYYEQAVINCRSISPDDDMSFLD